MQNAARQKAEQERILAEQQLVGVISKESEQTRSQENLSNSIEARERIVLQREQAAEEAMREANELYRQNQANAQRPIVKVNMDCPLLDDFPSFEQYQKLVKM